jgi:aminopeptidase N
MRTAAAVPPLATRRRLSCAVLSVVALCTVAVHELRADPYPRQPIDVQHYQFAIALADSTDRISAEARIRFAVRTGPLAQVWFDLASVTAARQGRGMVVSAVLRNGVPAPFRHESDRVTITLDRAMAAGDMGEIVIRYSGVPADGLQIKPTPLGDRAFFSDNWPTKGHHWLALIDHVGDKATMEMAVTAPSHYQVISNGIRVEETDDPRGTRRTVWRQSVPISPWLFALGVAHFAVQHVGAYAGIPIETWVFARQREAGFHDFAVPTKDALAFYSEWIGPFAYEKLVNVQSNSVSGGMEAASAIFYSAGSVSGTRPVRWRNVVIHEIAHQWFGDAVTEADWNDVWLSEGFATYFTLLFIEHAYGRDEFVAGLQDSRNTVRRFNATRPDYRVVHADLRDMADVTTPMIYQKGSWTLHMLRTRMGDDRFWSGIREYYARYRNGTATTADFRAVMERAAGSELGPFFQQWLYRGGVPVLDGTWSWDASAKRVTIQLRQTQAGEPFDVPVEFGIVQPGNTLRTERIQLTARDGRYAFDVSGEPTDVVLDPHVRLLFDGRLVRVR